MASMTVGRCTLAVSKYGGEFGCVDAACLRQGGPLGEGSIENDAGQGLGSAHQTGWTGLVSKSPSTSNRSPSSRTGVAVKRQPVLLKDALQR